MPCRSVAFLATQGMPCTTAEIARNTRVPVGYLAKVMQSLGRAGLVHSRRGLQGGFVLAVDPASVNILQVVAAVEPSRRIQVVPTWPAGARQAVSSAPAARRCGGADRRRLSPHHHPGVSRSIRTEDRTLSVSEPRHGQRPGETHHQGALTMPRPLAASNHWTSVWIALRPGTAACAAWILIVLFAGCEKSPPQRAEESPVPSVKQETSARSCCPNSRRGNLDCRNDSGPRDISAELRCLSWRPG